MSTHIEETSRDFSKFVLIDMEESLEPINKLINNMHARLEELQTMICIAEQERVNASSLVTSICDNQENLTDLFLRIDAVENVVGRVKYSLYTLEKDIEGAEEELGYKESTTSKVANIFIPLFKKNSEKKHRPSSLQFHGTTDYFHSNNESAPT